MRVILRFSIDNENNSHLRNSLAKKLTDAGFQRAENTATWENPHINKALLASAMKDFWAAVVQHGGPGRIDHFWMYADRTPLDDVAPEAMVIDD